MNLEAVIAFERKNVKRKDNFIVNVFPLTKLTLSFMWLPSALRLYPETVGRAMHFAACERRKHRNCLGIPIRTTPHIYLKLIRSLELMQMM
jgi:hypothetical protein